MKTNKASKRILSVTVRREVDENPDFSYLGEYSDTAGDLAIVAIGEYEGDFVDRLPCECGLAETEHTECNGRTIGEDCGLGSDHCCEFDRVTVEHGREYRYFNSGSVDSGNTDEENRKYAQQDYKRMRDYNRNEWCFVGVWVEAQVQLTGSLTQKVRSGGLWGNESDMGDSEFKQIEDEQLDELKDELHAIGFSKRAIAAAFRNVSRKEY